MLEGTKFSQIEKLNSYKLVAAGICQRDSTWAPDMTPSKLTWYPYSLDGYSLKIKEYIVDKNIEQDKRLDNNIKNAAYEFQSLELHLVLWTELYKSHVLEVTSKKNIIESVHAIIDQLLALSSTQLYNNKSFFQRIKKAKEINVINNDMYISLDKLNKKRNKIHLFQKESETENQTFHFSNKEIEIKDVISLLNKLISQIYYKKNRMSSSSINSFFVDCNNIGISLDDI